MRWLVLALIANAALAFGAVAQPATEAAPAPAQSAPQPGRLTQPSSVEQTGVAPDGPLSYSDMVLDGRIRASVAAAQGMQGPLDGRWTLYDADGKGLYVFQFVDPAGGRGPLEGAWRDLRRPAGSLAYGVVDSLAHEGVLLTAVFSAGSGVSLSLQALANGDWTGDITENGAKRAVTLRRY